MKSNSRTALIFGRRMEIITDNPIPMPNGGFYYEVFYKGQYLYIPKALIEGKIND